MIRLKIFFTRSFINISDINQALDTNVLYIWDVVTSYDGLTDQPSDLLFIFYDIKKRKKRLRI